MTTEIRQFAIKAAAGDNRLDYRFGSLRRLVAVEVGNDTKRMFSTDIRLRDDIYPKGNSCDLADIAGINGVSWSGSVRVTNGIHLEATIYACAVADVLYMKWVTEDVN